MTEPLHCEDFGCPPSEGCDDRRDTLFARWLDKHTLDETAFNEAEAPCATPDEDWDWDDVNGSADWEYAP